MKDRLPREIERTKFLISTPVETGIFTVKYGGVTLVVVVTHDHENHLSITAPLVNGEQVERFPTEEEIEYVKGIFFNPEDKVERLDSEKGAISQMNIVHLIESK